MPAFSYRHIKDLYPVFWSKARELIECLEKEISSDKEEEQPKIIVVRGWAVRTTLDIIGVAGMDHDFGALQNPNNSLGRHYRKMRWDPSRWQMLLGFILSLFTRRAPIIVLEIPTKKKKEAKEASQYIRDVSRKIIQEKQAKLKTEDADGNVDIISVALKSSVFPDENLVDQMMTFIAAGHGTTSHALQWAVFTLCKHQDIQERLRQEVRSKLPSITDSETTISAEEVDNLAYLQAFCNEILRFRPPVAVTVREAIQDTTVAGYHIPKGTIFSLAPGVTNVDKELWGPDADTFNPERWMKEGCTNSGGVQNNYGFLTFLHGPRNCIGAQFAKSELACLVAALVGRFRMELEDPNKKIELIQRGIGTAMVDGVRAKFEVVEGW